MKRELQLRGLVSLLVLTVAFAVPVAAVAPTSSTYRFDEVSIGNSNSIDSSSANFKSKNSAGDTAVGQSGSSNFQSQSGSNTTEDPNLSMVITSSSANFGAFSPSISSTATATFSVINYTSYGYVVQITGETPKNTNKQLNAMTTTAASSPGTEQFGINLVANTNPSSFGANPNNGTAPNDFGFGAATPNYGTANQYRYVEGESIAQAPRSSGKTDYTISYLVNVKPLTPGGVYKSNQTIIVTGTY